MGNKAANLPQNAVILTGAEFCTRFEAPLAVYRRQREAEVEEWYLALQVWQAEKAYVKACEKEYDALYDQAVSQAWKEVRPTFSRWTRWRWRMKGNSLIHHPKILARRDELLEAMAKAAHLDEDILLGYIKPPKLHHNFHSTPHPCYEPAVALLKQAQASPTDSFAIALAVVEFLQQLPEGTPSEPA